MSRSEVGKRYRPRNTVSASRGFPAKLIERGVTMAEVEAVLAENEIIAVISERRRYGLLGVVAGRPLHLWVADEEILGETVMISVYEPDEEHGWSRASGWRTRRDRR